MNPRPDDPLDEPDRRSPWEAGPSGPSGPSGASTGGSTAAAGADGPHDDASARADRSDGDAAEAAFTEPDVPVVGPIREPTPITQQLGRIVIVLLAVLFGVFAVDNSQAVDFSWVFGESRVAPDGTGGVPLIVLLVVAAVIGAALGALIEWQFLRGRRAKRADRDGQAR